MLEFAAAALGYLIGSVPMAIVVARAFGLADPRTQGSRNPGATNILRYGGKLAAALALAGDVLKGVVAVALTRFVTDAPLALALAGFAAFIGHLYPVFFGFKGGKGVATALGVWLALAPWVGVLLALTWIGVAVVFRYSSLSAIIAALAAPFYAAWLAPVAPYIGLSIAMSALLLFRHRANIRNLVAGTEGRIGR